MSFFKGSSIAFIIMCLSIMYVHQKVEILKAGYILQQNKEYLSSLVGTNAKLMFDLSKLESPENLLSSIDLTKIKFAGRRTQLSETYLLSKAKEQHLDTSGNILIRIMDIFTPEAEAKTAKR